jgi:cell division protein FtsZ
MQSNQQSEITAIGVGSAGTRMVSLLSKCSLLIDRFAYVSCDAGDLPAGAEAEAILVQSPVDQKLTPAMARGLALSSRPRIREAVGTSKVVFVVAGLGGATGSGLAPLVASIAEECGSIAVGVAVMPFEFEKKMKFHAGVALRRLREQSRGVIVIDNDVLMRSSPDDSTLTNLYESANKEALKTLSALLSRASERSVPVGLNKLLGTVLRDGYSLLGVSSSSAQDKAEDALAGAVVSLGKLAEAKEAEHAVVILNGNASLSGQEVGLVVKRLGSMINNQDVDVEYGVDYSGAAQLQVSLLASGFTSTKYDDYDPLCRILGGRVLDDEMDACVPEGLEALQSCD